MKILLSKYGLKVTDSRKHVRLLRRLLPLITRAFERIVRVLWLCKEEEQSAGFVCSLSVFLHSLDTQEVFARVPLHKIGSVLHYLEDSSEVHCVGMWGGPAGGLM